MQRRGRGRIFSGVDKLLCLSFRGGTTRNRTALHVLKISPVSRNDKDRTFTSTKGGNIAVTEIKQTVKKGAL